jgi:F-box protein 18 (helicase)
MRATPEQEAVIESKSPFLRVNAFAGAGKTTCMVRYAEERPKANMISISFSKAIQMEAQKKYPKNVRCVTSHGMAFPKFGSVYANAGKLTDKLRVNQVCDILNLSDYPDEFRYFVADACIKNLNRFFATEHEDINDTLLEGLLLPNMGIQHSDITALTQKLWQRMRDPNDPQVGMLHDGYLKLYQLSKPQLPYDVLLFDEAQDANPVTAAIVEAQQCDKVVVGDAHQAIFGFRLATNAMRKFKAEHTLYLTRSFRFGQEIADVANFILSTFKGEKKEIIGNADRGRVGMIAPKEPSAVIARANATLFSEAISAMKLGKKVHFVGGIAGYRLGDMMDAYNLWSGNKSSISSPYLRSFSNFDAMEEFAKAAEDRELTSLVNIVQRHGSKIPTLVSRVRQNAVEDPMTAHVHLATAHKAKGLEWTNVRLADDYLDLLDQYGRPRKIEFADEEEANILYVAATRAKRVLQPFPELQQILDAAKNEKQLSAAVVGKKKPEWATSAVARR